jgi:phospholipid/cholesterol/gamma-HCH transport system substrate-binding protein
MKVAQSEVEKTGTKVREKLDLADELLTHSGSIAKKIDSDTGTLGKLVNDPTIADNIEEITTDAKNFLGTLFRMQTYVGLRTEYNFFSQLARSYVTVEVATRPDKFYYIELEKGPRGDYPTVTLEYDPRIDDTRWVRRIKIEDQIRFTFQFGKRYHWASFRYGIKESTGGVGMDFHVLSDKLKMSVDVFDMTFDRFPRLKVSAAYLLFRHLYILAGADDLLNESREFQVDLGNEPTGLPTQFQRFRFGRDYFFGAMLRFNDHDLSQLLFIGGSTLGSALK